MESTIASSSAPSLSLRHLTKFYGDKLGVEDITLDVHPGEVMGFLGPNGSGKTTVIRMLTGLIAITRGEADILGSRVEFGNPSARRNVGYLPGTLGLYDNLTARDYFRFLSRMRDTDRRRHDHMVNAIEIADRLGLDVDVKIGSMSKGTRQKVGVVQAFMHRPQVLILDEPTSGLDPLVQRTFVELLGQARGEGAAVLLSSHVMHEVESIATHVAIILNGRQKVVDHMTKVHERVQRSLTFDFDQSIAHDTAINRFANCPNVVAVAHEGSTVTCTVVGSETELLRIAVDLGVSTVTSTEPTLEDLFYSVTGGSDGH